MHYQGIDGYVYNVLENEKIAGGGEGTIYAILVDQNNQTHDFILDNKNHKLSCDVSFLDAGEYTVKVYHYPDTNVLDLFLEEDTKTESDIITVTE